MKSESDMIESACDTILISSVFHLFYTQSMLHGMQTMEEVFADMRNIAESMQAGPKVSLLIVFSGTSF